MIRDEVFMREVEACERTLYRICRTMLRNEADCCDALQEALLKAWQHRKRIDETKFRAYLTRILINECHNIGRRRAKVVVVEEIPEQAAPEDERHEMMAALQKLDETHRLVLVMHYLEGYSLKEIAHVLCIPLGTVKYRIVAARRAFSKAWTLGFEEGGRRL